MRWLGVEEGHHTLSHEPDSNTAVLEQLTKINTWFAGEVAYLLWHDRLPDATEAGILSRLFNEQQAIFVAHPSDAVKLLAVGESAASHDLQPSDLAAMTSVVSAIMNFDEFVVMK